MQVLWTRFDNRRSSNSLVNMSRLPRIHSPPDSSKHNQNAPVMPTNLTSMKRKAGYDADFEALDQPRKLPTIGAVRPTPGQPLRELHGKMSNSAYIASSISGPLNMGAGPTPLTKPKAPEFTTTSRTARSTSAPPRSIITRSVSGSSIVARAAATRPVAGRAAGVSRPGNQDDKRFTDLQNQVTSIASARAADAAALAASMASERAKVTELQANHLAISRELANAKSEELNQRRELVVASDQIDKLRKKYQQEVIDLEMDLKKREREAKELSEELKVMKGDLERERETVSSLKTTLTHQATSHLTLTAQNNVLQSQITALQSSVDYGSSNLTSLKHDLETAQHRIAELEAEVREAEGVRRKLHNMVQELKGNIRVFCRVRPVLSSDRDGEGEGEAEADIRFLDKRDHKEIMLSSTSESAMGQERKEVYNFVFDRVCLFLSPVT